MIRRPIDPQAAAIFSRLDSLWNDVRRAHSGSFTTQATLEGADAAIGQLVANWSGDLRTLRRLLRAEADLADAAARDREQAA